MGIFSHDEDPDWFYVNKLKDQCDKYDSLLDDIIKNCPAAYKYDVYGIDTPKQCCYRFHNYCENIDCYLKQMIKAVKDGKNYTLE